MFPIFLQTLNIRVLTFDYFKIMTANSKNLELFIFALFKIKISRTKEFKDPPPPPQVYYIVLVYSHILVSKYLKNGKQGGIIKQRSSSLVVYEGLKLRALQGGKNTKPE